MLESKHPKRQAPTLYQEERNFIVKMTGYDKRPLKLWKSLAKISRFSRRKCCARANRKGYLDILRDNDKIPTLIEYQAAATIPDYDNKKHLKILFFQSMLTQRKERQLSIWWITVLPRISHTGTVTLFGRDWSTNTYQKQPNPTSS